MLFSNAPGKIPLPFAASGGKNTIPQASQISITPGAASLTDGFPPLTRTLISAGGIPPSGLDMNGILYETTAISTWANAGAGYKYDNAFATNSAVGGYPATARVARSDGLGYWINTVDNNTTDPESSGAAAAGWFPDLTTGSAAITMTNANVTLTPLQYGRPIIVITGTLTASLNLIFPAIVGEWTVINSTTGAYTITAKTAGGTGVTVSGTSAIVGDGTNINAVVSSAGTVTSVGVTTNASYLTVGSSPVTSSGNITVNKATGLTANQFVATPNGSTGAADLRAIVAADLPTATNAAKGIVQPDGTIITVSGGNITVAKASSSAFGVVEVDNKTITSTSGVIATSTPNFYQAQPSNPTGTTSTTGVMMGLAGSITPNATGVVAFDVVGSSTNSATFATDTIQIRYGTGSAPANAAALTGTAIGGAIANTCPNATNLSGFSCSATVSGLTLGTAYWFDVSLAASAGTASLKNLAIRATEIK